MTTFESWSSLLTYVERLEMSSEEQREEKKLITGLPVSFSCLSCVVAALSEPKRFETMYPPCASDSKTS